MKALTFQEIRNIVHAICEEVDTNYDDSVDTNDAIIESCTQYFIYHGDVWTAAMGMRFQYFDAWYDAEQSLEGEGLLDGYDSDERLFIIVHECLTMLVRDEHEYRAHLPEEK